MKIFNKLGYDMYVLACNKENSMIVNPGDDDWKVLLAVRGRGPGQLFLDHTPFSTTYDEYLGIMTTLPHSSIVRMLDYEIYSKDKIKIVST